MPPAAQAQVGKDPPVVTDAKDANDLQVVKDEAKDLKEDIQKKEGSVKAIINYEKIRESKSEIMQPLE